MLFPDEETRQAVYEDSTSDFEPESGDDETGDEEFLPPATDDESPYEEDAGEETEGDEEEDMPSESEKEEEAILDPATYTAKDGTKWGKAPQLPFTRFRGLHTMSPWRTSLWPSGVLPPTAASCALSLNKKNKKLPYNEALFTMKFCLHHLCVCVPLCVSLCVCLRERIMEGEGGTVDRPFSFINIIVRQSRQCTQLSYDQDK